MAQVAQHIDQLMKLAPHGEATDVGLIISAGKPMPELLLTFGGQGQVRIPVQTEALERLARMLSKMYRVGA